MSTRDLKWESQERFTEAIKEAVKIRNSFGFATWDEKVVLAVFRSGYRRIERKLGFREDRYRRGLIQGLKELDAGLARGRTPGQTMLDMIGRQRRSRPLAF